VTSQEAKELAARLICLARAADGFSMPLRIGARWVRTSDLPGFTEEMERGVRGLASLFTDYLARNPGLLDDCDYNTRLIVETELADVRKQLALIPKIAQGLVDLDIDEHCLPPSLGGTPEP
jgi:hypothetical protein